MIFHSIEIVRLPVKWLNELLCEGNVDRLYITVVEATENFVYTM